MSQAIVDPNELRRFAANLKKFNAELEAGLTALSGQLHSLSATWRDQEHKKFVEEFEQHIKAIARTIEATNEHAPFLIRKAERIEDYLTQR
ncbi:WXG100 family type VII secretion target [Aeoliella sp. ICT_H6.2]|uniref:WXG100 family type VII secretion target n=1 Tax=Aeoliella straminimaris TaxID=2954799 RepID=A0A9X2FDP4_9BACT|nr:WXG100 family type VII secretion target [Aeoliella straminimaris]MCO6046323.1 WXG100 family type VII secretion target [Aeoliella straminimaris]